MRSFEGAYRIIRYDKSSQKYRHFVKILGNTFRPLRPLGFDLHRGRGVSGAIYFQSQKPDPVRSQVLLCKFLVALGLAWFEGDTLEKSWEN